MARRNWSPGPNLAADQLLRDIPSGTHKQAVIHQQIKTKNYLVPQRAGVQQELS